MKSLLVIRYSVNFVHSATLEEVKQANVLVMVCDRSSPVWKKQRATVLGELKALGCHDVPLIEVWNKIDLLPESTTIRQEAKNAANGAILQIPESESSLLKTIDVESTMVNDDDLLKEQEFETEMLREDLNEILQQERERVSADSNSAKSSKANERAKHYTVAISATSGEGMDEFFSSLNSALNLYLESITVFIPYSQDDGIIAQIHQQGEVEHVDYQNEGTLLKCQVPDTLRQRILKFQVTS